MHTSLTLLHHVLATSPSPSGSSSKGGGLGVFLLPVLIFAVVYFAFLRPARNRQRTAAAQRKQVEVGDEVTTTAGLIATVVAVHDDYLTLEVAPGVHSRYVPAAILRVNNDEDESETQADDDAPGEHDGPVRDASTHEVIEQPATSGEEPGTTFAPPPSTEPPPVTEPPVVDVPPTVVDEPTVRPTDTADGTTDTPGGTPPI